MAKYGMVIDIAKCTACYGCFTACKDEYWENDYAPYSAGQPRFDQFWINLVKKERGAYPYIKLAYQPLLCQHCKNPPCLKAARDGAIYKKRNGIVIIDPIKAVGQKQLAAACPYGAIFWNEERKLAQKCTFCAHRLAKGQVPRCAQICPSGSITFGDLDDPESDVSKLLYSGKAEVFRPELKTLPNVFYINLQRITRSFVGGAVVLADTKECAEGAAVTLKGPGRKKMQTRTNAFGNFDIDGLETGQYALKIEFPGYKSQSMEVNIKESQYLGDIILNKV
jgi:Fe-S-cluster-containing dehydrogenase component